MIISRKGQTTSTSFPVFLQHGDGITSHTLAMCAKCSIRFWCIRKIKSEVKFEIKTLHSNSKEIDQSEDERFTDLLGHRWDKEDDKFTFKKQKIVGQFETLMRRNCLALLAQLWDPTGLVLPVTIKFRIDLQELWSSGYG